MKLFTVLLTLVLTVSYSFSQDMTQNIRGNIVDIDTKNPLIGVKVKVLDISTDEKFYGAATNYRGDFAIYNVPVGNHDVEFSFSVATYFANH